MKRVTHISLGILLFSFLAVGVSLAQKDVPGSKDHPLFNRMPGTTSTITRKRSSMPTRFGIMPKTR